MRRATAAPPAAAPPAAAFEGLLITFMANRRRLLAIPALLLLAAIAAALLLPVRYAVQSQLLVALGPEYTYRPQAGEPGGASQSLDHDATMHTEAEILGSPDLHRATLRAIGVGRLYPALLRHGVRARAAAALRGLFGQPPPPPHDPVELALEPFEAALSLDTPKLGSVITATFRHRDPVLGAAALNRLMALYVDRRAALFRDDQSAIVAGQVAVAKAAWDAAEDRLAAFQLAHGVGAFAARREILLRRQGELQSDRAEAQSQQAQLRARLDEATRQAARVPATIAAGAETDYEARLAPMRAGVEQLRAQYDRALQQYRPDAPLVTALRAQLDARAAELGGRRDGAATTVRSSQNPVRLSLEGEQARAQTDLAAAGARIAQDAAHLAELDGRVAELDRSEQALGQLQLQRALTEETYRSDTKTLQDRLVADAVEARRQPTVRILQPAVPPLQPPPQRLLILAAGAILAGFALCGATLLAHAFSRVYWQREALEQDFGIAVIATVPELSAVKLAALRMTAPRR